MYPRLHIRHLPTIVRSGLILCLLATSLVAGAARSTRAAAQDEWKTIGRLADLDPTALHDTEYAVPSNAFFVAPNGNDANPGAVDAPWATLAAAVQAAPAGATVVLREGSYRTDKVLVTKPLTLQPFPHEHVWIKGSLVVGDWVQDGSVWRKDGWTYAFPPLSSLPGGGAGCPATNPKCALDPAYPAADYRDMVFVNGQALRQVLRREDVRPATATSPATFYVDAATQQIFIGADPTGKLVEATAFLNGLEFLETAGGSVVRGLGFAHFGETAVRLRSPNTTFEHNTVVWNAVQGQVVNASAANSVIRANTFSYNGRKGMTAFGPPNLLVEGNLVSFNNVERFALSWDAAGMKLVPVDRAVVRGNLVQDNISNAIWYDNSATNGTIVYNLVRRNQGIGIFFEVSRGAIIAGNVSINNGMGIRVSGSSDVKVYNNTLARNAINLQVYDNARINRNPAEVAAGIDYETRNVAIKNNIFAAAQPTGNVTLPSALLNVTQDPCGTTGPPCNDTEQMLSALDSNLYYRTDPSQPSTLILWRPNALINPISYTNLADFRAATGFEQNGIEISGQLSRGLFPNEERGDFRLLGNTPGRKDGEPLPADVAAALGLKPNAKLDVGAPDPKLR